MLTACFSQRKIKLLLVATALLTAYHELETGNRQPTTSNWQLTTQQLTTDNQTTGQPTTDNPQPTTQLATDNPQLTTQPPTDNQQPTTHQPTTDNQPTETDNWQPPANQQLKTGN
jgi:hypothetical protein